MKKIFTLLSMVICMSWNAQNLLTNGSFENWTAQTPDGWFGSTTNFAASGVTEATEAHDGVKSVKLVNTSSTHRRFASQGINLMTNTNYIFSFYMKGNGEVRNAWHNGIDYSSYSAYNTASSDWQKITYKFTTGTNVTGAEMIFSVRNTTADGVLIDNAVLAIDTGQLGVISSGSIPVSMPTVWTSHARFTTQGKAQVEIYSTNGQLMQTAAGTDNFDINVSFLPKGVYIAKVMVNGHTFLKKAMKK